MGRRCFRPPDVVPGELGRTVRTLGLASPHPGIALASHDLAFRNEISGSSPLADGPFEKVAFQEPPGDGQDGTSVTSILVRNMVSTWSPTVYTVACDGRTLKIVQVEATP